MSTQSDTFLQLLAHFLAHNVSSKSVALAAGSVIAQEWKDLRTAAGLFGYPTVQETEVKLRTMLCEERKALEKLWVLMSVPCTPDTNMEQVFNDALTLVKETLK